MQLFERTAVVLKPTELFLNWLKKLDEEENLLPDLTLTQLRSNCSVFLVPEFDEPEQAVAYFDERFEEIFEAELSAWNDNRQTWPQERNLKTFWEFFDLEIHDTVVDMEDDIVRTPTFDNMA